MRTSGTGAGSCGCAGPGKDGTSLDQWVGTAALHGGEHRAGRYDADDSHHWLFSRSGPPTDLGLRVLSRAWIVAACSGVTLVFGFLAIFARIRFRTAWAIVAVLALLAATLLQPSMTWLGLQSAFMGAALTLLGLLIQRLLDRPKAATPRPGRRAPRVARSSAIRRSNVRRSSARTTRRRSASASRRPWISSRHQSPGPRRRARPFIVAK